MAYQQRAVYIMKQFLEEFSVKELTDYANAAYGPDKFDSPAVAPVHTVDGSTHCLELWHGPTCAFKDMALTLLPYLLRKGCDLCGIKEEILILVATSGTRVKPRLKGSRTRTALKLWCFIPRTAFQRCKSCKCVRRKAVTSTL